MVEILSLEAVILTLYRLNKSSTASRGTSGKSPTDTLQAWMVAGWLGGWNSQINRNLRLAVEDRHPTEPPS